MAFVTRTTQALRQNWRHYLVEAGGIMAFLTFWGLAAVLCHHLNSALTQALGAREWVQRAPHLWLYFMGPLGAMWATAEAYRRRRHPPTELPPRFPNALA